MTENWTSSPAAPVNEESGAKATRRQGELTKPPGSLGRLEEMAITLARLQGNDKPEIKKIRIVIFAGDHGVAGEEPVSAFPQVVTTEMVKNFARGGAAISVLSKSLGADLEVVNVGTVVDPGELNGVVSSRIAAGTANFATGAAMTDEELGKALSAGKEAVKRSALSSADLFIGGDMGIGNTTSASAVACALLKMSGKELAGPGTGLNSEQVAYKAEVIDRALGLHADAGDDPMEILRRLGGFEIAALAGAYIASAQQGIPALVDGFITTVGALAAVRINPSVRKWLLFSHASAEPAHQKILAALDADPLIDLNLRLGEASGAAVCVPLLRLASDLHNNMATFAEAGVSEGE